MGCMTMETIWWAITASDAVGDGGNAGKNCAKNIHVRLCFCSTGLMYEIL